MVLIDYSESDSDDTSNHSPPAVACKKRKAEVNHPTPTTTSTNRVQPPPLPSTFHTLYTTAVRTSTADDPSLHGGRKRQVIHVAGNWPSHIYLEWLPSKAQLKSLDDMITTVQRLITPSTHAPDGDADGGLGAQLTSFLRSPLSAQLPLHISLSAPLVLNTSSKDAFRDRVRDAIARAAIGRLVISFKGLDIVPNFEGSRWFLVLRVVSLYRGLSEGNFRARSEAGRLLDVCNGVCDEFGLAKLYQRVEGVGANVAHERETTEMRDGGGDGTVDGLDERAFHVSIAWMLDEVSKEIRNEVSRVDLGELGKTEVDFHNVKVKIGNVVDGVPL